VRSVMRRPQKDLFDIYILTIDDLYNKILLECFQNTFPVDCSDVFLRPVVSVGETKNAMIWVGGELR
jgi:hypothetical protein